MKIIIWIAGYVLLVVLWFAFSSPTTYRISRYQKSYKETITHNCNFFRCVPPYEVKRYYLENYPEKLFDAFYSSLIILIAMGYPVFSFWLYYILFDKN